MDDEAIGLIAWILIGVGGLVVAVGATGGIMYAADTTVGAVVTDTQCAGGGGGGGGGILGVTSMAPQGAASAVSIKTKFPFPGIDYTMTDFDDDTCLTLAGLRSQGKEPFAEYRIRSGHTVLYDEEGGKCLYDSASATPLIC